MAQVTAGLDADLRKKMAAKLAGEHFASRLAVGTTTALSLMPVRATCTSRSTQQYSRHSQENL